VAAEATVSASGPETGRREAFRVLFDYISGANQGRSEVAMTTPVEATGTCACADRSESRDRRNSRTSVAVLRFSGSRDEERVDEREAELMETVASSEWDANGTPTALFYDPPWTLPFLRRNAVSVAVESP
jgi:hypothetical protein